MLLQDVIRFKPFAQTVLGQMQRDPLFLPAMLGHVGPVALLDWLKHFVVLGMYDVGFQLLRPALPKLLEAQGNAKAKFKLKRCFEALEFGSGYDHV
jgi:lycopene cyclase CruP